MMFGEFWSEHCTLRERVPPEGFWRRNYPLQNDYTTESRSVELTLTICISRTNDYYETRLDRVEETS